MIYVYTFYSGLGTVQILDTNSRHNEDKDSVFCMCVMNLHRFRDISSKGGVKI